MYIVARSFLLVDFPDWLSLYFFFPYSWQSISFCNSIVALPFSFLLLLYSAICVVAAVIAILTTSELVGTYRWASESQSWFRMQNEMMIIERLADVFSSVSRHTWNKINSFSFRKEGKRKTINSQGKTKKTKQNKIWFRLQNVITRLHGECD